MKIEVSRMPSVIDVFSAADRLKVILLSRAQGGSPDDSEYTKLRSILVHDSSASQYVPIYVKNYRHLDEFWAFIKVECSSYKERRDFITKTFSELLDYLEEAATKAGPSPTIAEVSSPSDNTLIDSPTAPSSALAGQLFDEFFRIPLRQSTKAIPAGRTSAAVAPSRDTLIPQPRVGINRVFLVHGHDEAAKYEVARFLEKLELKVVILDEQANSGRTIVEKLEEHTDVECAVILLTPDDLGGKVGADPNTFRGRARQNVIMELGLFIGKLGRSRVCVLHKENLELPTDIHGLLYTPLDSGGGWKNKLVQELKAAGLSVDANKAYP